MNTTKDDNDQTLSFGKTRIGSHESDWTRDFRDLLSLSHKVYMKIKVPSKREKAPVVQMI